MGTPTAEEQVRIKCPAYILFASTEMLFHYASKSSGNELGAALTSLSRGADYTLIPLFIYHTLIYVGLIPDFSHEEAPPPGRIVARHADL